MKTQPIDQSVLENIQWLKDQLEEQECLLGDRITYILHKICERFGVKLDGWSVVGMYDGVRLIDCIDKNFISGYRFEWVETGKTITPMVILIENKMEYLTDRFPTRWLTENFEEELERLTSEI